ncbi:hypothetical protein [Halomonas sp. MM17-34]|uniref:hypothetical protein n=1 Tax=Halomonas sp. MM17-34 TaxID=2917742 RepID=UPI001EF55F76|nr:hypothetical protein [Halomonas sp. MM17-34]MCG7605728.1 hypothetical protein [Halomonas sp. MM17-34]
MLQLSVLIAVICVPILAMLAMGAKVEKRQRDRAKIVQERAKLMEIYKHQF